jgi:3-oxoacyl-[acyl-carrier-protein] synthase-3
MAFMTFNGVGITAMAAAVPRHVIKNYEYTDFFSKEEVKQVVDKIGIFERRFADEKTCSSDLCYSAAEQLFKDNNIDRNEIDLLIFISQTPDYRMPATSILLQDRLGLNMSCMAFDISLGCAAFAYGLTVAYSMIQAGGIRKALILDGETRSKVYSPKDRRTAFLFGDGGIAALVEGNEKFGSSFFSIHSDGSLGDLIKIEGGGYRHPSSLETIKEKVVDEHGNIRSDEQGSMNGGDVFSFVLANIPKDIKLTLEHACVEKDNIDFFVFHQANDFMNKYIIKKLKLPTEKVPSTIAKYGNTSSVSVPLTIVSELQNKLKDNKTLLLSSFGVGMSWSTAIVPFINCNISEIVEV